MADDQLEDKEAKTEEPTQKRLEEALEKGQVVNSKEVTTFFMLFTFAGVLIWLLPPLGKAYFVKLSELIVKSGTVTIDSGSVGLIMMSYINHSLLFLSPLFLLAIFSAIFSSFIQHGQFIMSNEQLMPDLSRLSISKGLERMFSMKSLFEFAKGIFKVTLVGMVVYLVIKSDIHSLLMYQDMSIDSIFKELLVLIKHILVAVVMIVAVLAGLDFAYQSYEHYKSLRMSKYELKQEFKQTEGNPEIKQKQKSIARERLKNQVRVSVPKADVIITNPEHYAVAIQYDAAQMEAPIVVAKGVDLLAQAIKEVAKESDVPIVRNPPLARSLYKQTPISHMIPTEHYQAVAKVISYVYSLKGKKHG